MNQNNITKKEMKMGTMPVNRLLLTMGIPMILSMMLQAVYNIVDSAFVSNMAKDGELALNALTLAFPVQMLMVAIGIGTGVGTNVLLAKSLGEKNTKKASTVAGNAIVLAGIIYVAFLVFGIWGAKSYIASQTTNPVILQMGTEYLQICCIFSFGITFFSIYEKLLQATGKSLFSTIAQVAGALTNIILDPILIYGMAGMPAMGVKGAAYATIIGQIVSFLTALLFHLFCNKEVKNGLSYMRPSMKLVAKIYAIGLPAIIAQALMSVMTYGLNRILGMVGENLVTAYGLFYKIQQFILFAAFGLRDAITPVISFSFGMQNKTRIKEGEKYGMTYTLTIMLIGTLLLECFALPFSRLFGLSGETQQLCISAMHIISISFLFAGANIAFQGIFQALDSGMPSLVLSLCRQFIFVLPVAWAFAAIAGQNPNYIWLLWITFPIAEILSCIIGGGFLHHINRNKVEELGA